MVDAAEGPMPQTRFVLSRALELGHKVIIVINKIDRPDRRIDEVIDEILELLIDLNATDDQLEAPILFCSARRGIASADQNAEGTDLRPLFETILSHIPAPEADYDQPFQMLVSALDYNEFVGRIAVGRIERGKLTQNQDIIVCNYHDDNTSKKLRASNIYEYDGLTKKAITEAYAGNIIAISGIGDITIGDTICDPNAPEPLPFRPDLRTDHGDDFCRKRLALRRPRRKICHFTASPGPSSERARKDVSLGVTETDSTDAFNVAGRGEMHLSILMENMRREGYEFAVCTTSDPHQRDQTARCANRSNVS